MAAGGAKQATSALWQGGGGAAAEICGGAHSFQRPTRQRSEAALSVDYERSWHSGHRNGVGWRSSRNAREGADVVDSWFERHRWVEAPGRMDEIRLRVSSSFYSRVPSNPPGVVARPADTTGGRARFCRA